MLLKSLKLIDFRCYRGTNIIDLNCKNGKNIIAILGDNTRGKSTIVQSFVWCFYGISNFDNPEIYNRAIARNLSVNEYTIPTVEVVFEHDKQLYTARREEKFIKNIEGKMVSPAGPRFYMTVVDNMTGQTKPCGQMTSELNKAINSIISRDLAPYFFFEGEKNNELTTKSLSSAVKTLIGLEPLVNMRNHIRGNTQKVASKSVMGYYAEKQVDPNNQNAQNELNKKVKAESLLESIKKRLDEIENEIGNYESRNEEINLILREAAPTKDIQNRIDSNNKSMEYEEKALDIALKRYISDFNDKAVSLFTLPILNKARKQLDSMDLSDKGIPGIEMKAIKALLERGVCLCGTDLNVGTLAYKNVEKYLDILPPKSIGVLVRELQEEMDSSEYDGKESVDTFNKDYASVMYSVEKIHEYERLDKVLSDQLKDKDVFNTEQYVADLNQNKERLKNLKNEKSDCLINKGAQESAIETAENNYNMYKSKSNVALENAKYYAYANAIFEWLSTTYDEKEKTIRNRLEQAVTEMFNSIYSGNRKVYIDDNYNIQIIPMADTGGLKVIQYFSYVGGLVKVAREVMDERDENKEILSGGEYPLVLDAAFSHADANHTRAIAVQLSKVTNQLIFAVMDKDWEHVGNSIDDRIWKTYKLNKLNEDEVIIEEA